MADAPHQKELDERELDELKEEITDRSGAATVRIRGVVAIVLVILSAFAVAVSTVAWWVRYVALDTDALMAIVEPAFENDQFTDALGTLLAEEAVAALDLETRLDQRLSAVDEYISTMLIEAVDPRPEVLEFIQGLDLPGVSDLAEPISAALNERITAAITGFVSSEEFQKAFIASFRFAHETMVALVTDDLESLPNLYVEGEEVKWNALPLVVNTLEFVVEERILGGEQITLPDLSDNPVASEAVERTATALGYKIPDDLGQITVMTADDLENIQAWGRTFQRAFWVLIGLTIALAVVAIVVSPRRRRTIIQVSLATGVAAVVAGLGIRWAVESIQTGILLAETISPNAVLGDLLTNVRDTALTILLISLLVAVLAWFAGRPKQVERWLEIGRYASDRTREPSEVDLFVGRYFDGLAVLVVLLSLLVAWLVDLNWIWLTGILLFVGAFLWYGLSARARHDLDLAVDEVLEEEDAEEAAAVVD